MTEVETLRAELAELRKATGMMFALTTHCLAGSATSAQALALLFENLAALNAKADHGEVFDAMSIETLRAVSSIALKQHPQDPDVVGAYQGLRPGERH